MITAPVNCKPNFYGGMVRDAKLDPRRELVLPLEIQPRGKVTFEDRDVVDLRFGAIEKFHKSPTLLVDPPQNGLHCLRELSKSEARRHIVAMEFDRTNRRIRIVTGKIAQSDAETAVKT